jgi:bile acid:Na+ symporter, BASS family
MSTSTLQTFGIQALVLSMMAAIGLRLTLSDLLEVTRQKRAFLVALALNVAVFPAVAWAVCEGLELPPALATGIMLCAAAPGGPTGPMFAGKARGHLGFATALMVTLALASVISAPLTVVAFLGAREQQDLLLPMLRTLVLFQLSPLVAGLLCRRFAPEVAARLAGPLLKVANVLLLVIIVALIVLKGKLLGQISWRVQLAMNGLILLSLVSGFAASRDSALVRATSHVTAVRNLSIALLLSASYFPLPETDATILSFGFYIMVVPFIVGTLWGRRPPAPAATR